MRVKQILDGCEVHVEPYARLPYLHICPQFVEQHRVFRGNALSAAHRADDTWLEYAWRSGRADRNGELHEEVAR